MVSEKFSSKNLIFHRECMHGSLTFLPHSNFAGFDGWYFIKYCLHLVHIYGHGFYELSRKLKRKNVNNDVSKDSPIELVSDVPWSFWRKWLDDVNICSREETQVQGRLSQNCFQKFKQMPVPDRERKMLCVILPNRRTVSPEFFSWIRTHNGYCSATLARLAHQACARKGNFYFLLS